MIELTREERYERRLDRMKRAYLRERAEVERLREHSVPITHLPLAPFDNASGTQRLAGSRDDRIQPNGDYLARIHGVWYLGTFTEQWYGWNFEGWGASGIQLDLIEDLYEVDLLALH